VNYGEEDIVCGCEAIEAAELLRIRLHHYAVLAAEACTDAVVLVALNL
jgi:hypothetical protein